MTYKQYDFESFKLLTIKTDQFKNCHMEINFIDDVHNLNTAHRAFLTSLLSYTTKKYQTKRELLIALENLYNSEFASGSARIGETFLASFNFEFLNPSYVQEQDYLEQCIKMFCESLLNPDLENERSIAILKEQISAALDRYKESAISFARKKSREFLFQDSITGKSFYNTKEEVESIQIEDLKKDYETLFQDSKVHILVIGDLDMDYIAECFKQYFVKKTIVEKEFSFVVPNKIMPYQELEVEGKYKQTQVLYYLQYENLTMFEQQVVAPLYVHILGNANLSDKLAQYLRVLNPLAYSSVAFNINSDQYIVIQTGIQYKNLKEAQKGILKAIDEMKNGEISLEYFEAQKRKMISSLEQNVDDEYYLVERYYFHELFQAFMPTLLKEKIEQVTIEDLIVFAKKLHLSLVYILKEAQDERD